MKKVLFVFLVLVLCGTVSFAETAFDFDNSSSLDDKDLAIFIAWKQLVNAGVDSSQITTALVLQAAKPILTSVSTVSRLPDLARDNLSNESTNALDDQDIAYFIAYNQLVFANAPNFTFTDVETVAGNLLTLTTKLGKFPGTPIGDSTFSTTVTGIQVDQ